MKIFFRFISKLVIIFVKIKKRNLGKIMRNCKSQPLIVTSKDNLLVESQILDENKDVIPLSQLFQFSKDTTLSPWKIDKPKLTVHQIHKWRKNEQKMVEEVEQKKIKKKHKEDKEKDEEIRRKKLEKLKKASEKFKQLREKERLEKLKRKYIKRQRRLKSEILLKDKKNKIIIKKENMKKKFDKKNCFVISEKNILYRNRSENRINNQNINDSSLQTQKNNLQKKHYRSARKLKNNEIKSLDINCIFDSNIQKEIKSLNELSNKNQVNFKNINTNTNKNSYTKKKSLKNPLKKFLGIKNNKNDFTKIKKTSLSKNLDKIDYSNKKIFNLVSFIKKSSPTDKNLSIRKKYRKLNPSTFLKRNNGFEKYSDEEIIQKLKEAKSSLLNKKKEFEIEFDIPNKQKDKSLQNIKNINGYESQKFNFLENKNYSQIFNRRNNLRNNKIPLKLYKE